jgi:hypothetical protein
MKNRLKLILFLYFINCARFQIYDLTPTLLLSIPIDEVKSTENLKNFMIPINIKENLIFNLPQHPTIWENEILLTIPEKNLIAYFSKISEKPDLLITSKNFKDDIKKLYPKIIIKTFPEGVVGQSCIQSNYFLIQIFQQKDTTELLEPVEPENRLPAILYPQTKDANPSQLFIVYKTNLSSEKEPLNIKSINSEYFKEFLNIYCFEKHISIVRYISEKEVMINHFLLDNNEFLEEKIDIKSIQGQNNNEFISFENIIPLENREIYFEVVLRDKKNYNIINKKIYKYIDKNFILILENDDVSSLFYVFPDNSFYLIKEEDGDLLINIYDSNTHYIKNNRIIFNFDKNYWKEYFINQEGRIFSTKIENHTYSIVEWK